MKKEKQYNIYYGHREDPDGTIAKPILAADTNEPKVFIGTSHHQVEREFKKTICNPDMIFQSVEVE